MKTIISLSLPHVSRLRELVNERQDALFDKLTRAVADKASDGRQEGLRDSLKFWSAIDNALKNAVTIDDTNAQTSGPLMSYGEAQELAAFLAARRDNPSPR